MLSKFFSKLNETQETQQDTQMYNENLPLTSTNKHHLHRFMRSKLRSLTSCDGCIDSIGRYISKAKGLLSIKKGNPFLLGPQPKHLEGRKTLVLDLDETLVHSTAEFLPYPDFILPIFTKDSTYHVNIHMRPGLEEFLAKACELFEVVIFTASRAEYAGPLVKKLDKDSQISSVLFRDSCTIIHGSYVKDMSKLGRDLKDIILIDNAAESFALQPENGLHIKNFFTDKSDNELPKLISFLEYLAKHVNDVRPVVKHYRKFELKITKPAKKLKSPASKILESIIMKKNSSLRIQTEASDKNTSLASGSVLNGSVSTAGTKVSGDKEDSNGSPVKTPEFCIPDGLDLMNTPKKGDCPTIEFQVPEKETRSDSVQTTECKKDASVSIDLGYMSNRQSIHVVFPSFQDLIE